MIFFSPQKDPDWLGKILPVLATEGVAVVESVIDADFIERARKAIYGVQKKIWADVGKEKLDQAGELGVLRLMMKYDPFFFKFLELPEVLEIINQTVSPTAVLHTQNGFVLPSFPKSGTPQVFQNQFHMDFPRVFKGHMLSINAYFAIDEFRADNGATLVVPGSHQRETRPEQAEIEAKAVPAECPAGSMIVFDSTLWHAAGRNTSGKDRLSLNHQFTRSYFKQQIDYVRALGDSLVLAQKPRVQQLLGWYTRVPTSLNDYYKPQEERLYRKEQG